MLNIGNCAKILAEKYRNCFGLPFRTHLSEEDIQSVVRTSTISWRERVFSPSVTIWAMLSQILNSERACRQVSARVAAYLIKRIVADILPNRPNRVEPRVRKRRPKSYKLLTLPRHEARRRLVG